MPLGKEKKRLFVEARISFHEMHWFAYVTCTFVPPVKVENVFYSYFSTIRGIDVPPWGAWRCLSKREKCALVRFCCPIFFHEKLICWNISIWDLVLKFSTKGIQRWKPSRFWRTVWEIKRLNKRIYKKTENSQAASSGLHAVGHLSQPSKVGVTFAKSAH